MPENKVLEISEPFSYPELEKMGISIKRTELEKLVTSGHLNKKKIGRTNVYWRKVSQKQEPTTRTGLESLVKQHELEIQELKYELQAEREKVRKLSIQDGIDEPWKEAAMAMARILSEQKQISLREVLEYFNAPIGLNEEY
ncbi:MAG: hypothetical protein ACTSW1_03650 [Candidatus Hodarchaeales archaeon]